MLLFLRLILILISHTILKCQELCKKKKKKGNIIYIWNSWILYQRSSFVKKKKNQNISNLIRKITFKYKGTFFRQLSFNVRLWSHELRISKMLTATHAAVMHASAYFSLFSVTEITFAKQSHFIAWNKNWSI